MTGAGANRSSDGHDGDDDLGLRLGLDVVGLAAAFGDYASRHRVPPERQRDALGAWLDELIDELDQDRGGGASDPDARDHEDG